MPVSIMGGNTVQLGDRVMEAIGENVILGGLQLRIGIAPGAVAGLLLIAALLAAEESGEGIKAEAEIPEGITALAAIATVAALAITALRAAITAITAAEGIVIA